MKHLVILGHGTGGTIIAAKMRQRLAEQDWQITVIDRDWQHHYQPGWLFIPFGIYTSAVRLTDLKKSENSRNLLEWVSPNALNRKENSDYGPL